MKIKWLESAVIDLMALREYIAEDKPKVAQNVAKKIIASISHLEKHPYMGRVGRVPNTRELIIANLPYIAPYQVKNNVIEVLRILHMAMQWSDK